MGEIWTNTNLNFCRFPEKWRNDVINNVITSDPYVAYYSSTSVRDVINNVFHVSMARPIVTQINNVIAKTKFDMERAGHCKSKYMY